MNSKEYRFTKEWPHHVSCGGIVYRLDGEGVKILALVHCSGKYDIPKGTLRYDGALEQCALREVEEESGQKGEVSGITISKSPIISL